MKLLQEGNPLIRAAVRAEMSEPTARKYVHSGQTPSETKVPRTWRTRPDPYAHVWPEIEGCRWGMKSASFW